MPKVRVRGRKPAHRRTRGSAFAGALLAGVVVVLAGLAWVMAQGKAQPLAPARANDIAAAMSRMPLSDVEGEDLAGLPRPPAGIRAFFQRSGSVATIVYDVPGDPGAVWAQTTERLARSGWSAARTPGTLPAEGAPAVFSRDQALLQASWFTGTGLVAVSYVVRTKA